MGNGWSSSEKRKCCSHDGTTRGVRQAPAASSRENPQSGHPQSSSTALSTLQDRIDLFEKTAETWNIETLIEAIDQLFKSKLIPASASTSTPHIPSGSTDWASAINSGATFLKFLNEHTQEINAKDDLFGSSQGKKVVEEILQQLGQLHWMVAGFSIIAYLLNKVEKVSENRSECIELLKCMFDFVKHIKKLKGLMPHEGEKLREALMWILQGCMTCASLLESGKIFSFLKTSVDSQALKNLSSKINGLYKDLDLATDIDTLATVKDIKKDQPSYLPILHSKYPQGAVGLEKPLEELKKKLDLQTTKVSSLVLVIYGFGGIGKSTLANALVASSTEDLKNYNYTKVEISEDPLKNDFKSMQEQILRDCFPTYQSEGQKLVTNCENGRNHMEKAFNCEANKSVFLYIDNALRSNDLEELLPEDLRGLPQRSRILVTTRNMSETDLFDDRGIQRHIYPVSPLDKEHALNILCKDPTQLDQISDPVERILKIAGGIPLVLKIVGARLRKQKYKVENCSQILNALEDGGEIKEENLSARLVHFVYNDLEPSTQEAFLDICSFFNGQSRRFVEYIVGVEEVRSLADGALVTFSPFFNSFEKFFEDVLRKRILWRRMRSRYLREKFLSEYMFKDEERVIVHDVIQAKGRSMGESTRIKDWESWSRAAECRVQDIKGVWLEGHKHVLEERHLSRLKHSLRILYLGYDISINACSSQTFEKLRYLELDTQTDCLPVNLEGLPSLSVYIGPLLSKLPKKLKYLECFRHPRSEEFSLEPYSDVDECESLVGSKSIQAVRNSSLEVLSVSEHSLQLRIILNGRLHFHALKVLNLRRLAQMEELLPKVCCWDLPSLNKLIVEWCGSLKSVPDSIANLRELTHLSLRGCYALREVSSSLGELKALRHLELGGCGVVTKLPDNFGGLSALEYLGLGSCLKLEELPDNFAQLRSLKGLDLSNCWSLRKLPSNFVQLTGLKVLGMTGVKKLLAGLGEIDNNWKIID